MRKDSQNAWSQIASVKEKEIKPIIMDARETGARVAICKSIEMWPCETYMRYWRGRIWRGRNVCSSLSGAWNGCTDGDGEVNRKLWLMQEANLDCRLTILAELMPV